MAENGNYSLESEVSNDIGAIIHDSMMTSQKAEGLVSIKANYGYFDRGYFNRGYSNRGYSNRGYFNRGYCNRGYCNRGYCNRG